MDVQMYSQLLKGSTESVKDGTAEKRTVESSVKSVWLHGYELSGKQINPISKTVKLSTITHKFRKQHITHCVSKIHLC